MKYTEQAARRITRSVFWLQTSFAKAMQRSVGRLSLLKLKGVMIGFVLLWGGYSLFLLADAVTGKSHGAIQVDAISPLPTLPPEIGKVIDEQTYQEIKKFQQSPVYDSMILESPGLTDSIRLLEELYKHQNK